jgi:uncharacterized membrane protein YqiK
MLDVLWAVPGSFWSAGSVVLALVLAIRGGAVRLIPNRSAAVVEKLWSLRGSVAGRVIALDGEAGYQPQVLRGGLHFFFPFQHRLHRVPLVTIPQGEIGYVFARDGASLPASQTLGANPPIHDFQDAAQFLRNGGQKGLQRKILREGTYAINLAQFVVLTRRMVHALELDPRDEVLFDRMRVTLDERLGFEPLVIKEIHDSLGLVTVHDGPVLPAGEIVAPRVGDDPAKATFHNGFQEPDRFLAAGGRRGRQLQVLLEGTHYLNRLFATPERAAKTVIEAGQVGVVISYAGADSEGGVQAEPLLPGKHAFNTYAGKVLIVPTADFTLKWDDKESGAHGFDKKLTAVSATTRDGIAVTLPVSAIVRIDSNDAPRLVQRFGDIRTLVEQTLDPIVTAWLRNAAETHTLLQLREERAAIEQAAGAALKDRFAQGGLDLQDLLVGTPSGGIADHETRAA